MDEFKCGICGKEMRSGYNENMIHYIDGDEQHTLISNVMVIHKECHSKINNQPVISISKQFSFAAAHKLPRYKGKCHNLHGHEWILEVYIKQNVNSDTSMVIDFKVLKEIVEKHIISLLDHNYINDIIDEPTAENILIWIWDILMSNNLKGINKIKLWESPGNCAEIDLDSMCHFYKERTDKK